jgi:hypothetical protein
LNVDKTVTAVQTGIVGFALYVDTLPGADTNFLEFRESAILHVAIRLNAAGTISALRSTTVLGTSTNTIAAGAYNYIEVKARIDESPNGTVEVRVNGTNSGWLNLTAQDTQNAGTAVFNTLRFNAASSRIYDYDDLYVCDTAGGAPNNDFLGDIRVDFYGVTGNGAVNQFARSSGSANYEMVDDATPDGDSTYVYDSIPNRQELYNVADMTHTPLTIMGIQGIVSARKSDAGSRTHQPLIRSGSTIYPGSAVNLSTTYAMYADIRGTDPDTAAAWTSGGVNAVQVGSEVD